jgi:type 1 glutamine amidotransferase
MMTLSFPMKTLPVFFLAAWASLPLLATDAVPSAPAVRKVVLIAGPKSHGPVGNGQHDYPWSAKLLKVLLDRSNIHGQVHATFVLEGWPQDERVLDDADTVMIISDGRDSDAFKEAPHLATPEHLAATERLMQRGCGLITFHFSTFASEEFHAPVLDWSGGYFQWETEGKRQWYSALTTLDAAVALPSPEHAIARGVKPFQMKDEFYYNLRFAADHAGITPLLAVPALPGREPDGHWVAWARERAGGGRSFGTTAGHYYDNWKNDDFRKLILNAIAWTAHIEVPSQGVESPYLDREAVTAALATETP